MKDAIAFVKKQNLDLQNGDYFDIHTGYNTSEPDELDFWGGTRGYWYNVLNNPKTNSRKKDLILSREVKSLTELHENKEDSSMEEDASSAGTVASLGAAPTAVVGKKPVEAKETRICEELKALQEALKG
jgi:hypothetical protein